MKIKEYKKIEKDLIKYFKRKISGLPKIYKKAKASISYEGEAFEVIRGLESKVKD